MDRNPKADGGPYIGRSLPRFEDLRLVRGGGRYSDDVSVPGQAYAAFVRSPHAHARIVRIDAAAARAMPGVIAVLTGADYVADGLKGAMQRPNPAGAIDIKVRAFDPVKRPVLDEPQHPIAVERVRFPGEAVAMVVAASIYAARDAAEAVLVEYEVLRAATDVLSAGNSDAIWVSAPDNVALDQEFGDAAAVQAALAKADLVVEHTFRNQRIVNCQMEPRSGVASYDHANGNYTLVSGNQGVHVPRMVVAESFGLPPDKIRFVCPDVGGGFGLRNNLYPEQAAILWAAKRTGKPVKWTNDRSESFLTDYGGRDLVTTARLALTRDGKITAYQVDHIGTCGGHTVTYVPLSNAYRVATTTYDIPLMHMRCRSMMTNTAPTAPFRGAGRPEATLVLERLIDLAAARLGMDRVALRRKNLIGRGKLPYRTASGLLYDSGDFTGNMKRVLESADWKGFAARKRQSKKHGKLRGIGISNYVETPVGIPHERVEVTVRAEGAVELAVGTQSTGQGHETTFAQVMADLLGVKPEEIVFIGGDTAKVASGSGTHSDRSMRLGGTLMVQASGDVVTQAKAAVAKLLSVSEREVDFSDGSFAAPGSNRRLTIYDVARAVADNPALAANGQLHAKATFTGRIPAYPTGCAICEVEVDPDTGTVEIVRYSSIDDAGQAINPMILHGQVHGGIVQGLGQALSEDVAYGDNGQVLSGSFMDYALPRARSVPSFAIELAEDPTKGNPLRVKGGGEAGITPALAVAMNAIMDALKGYGIEHIDMPATPHRIWRAIRDAKGGHS
ncbi:MAG: xanthine dehydrogenase family protein molybdopterin-binding subunit [Alphaproteobacteria bacterium]|nr:xanthine dehydrogenase family protein molybdopterin-binding subunit [Alphaproteobacteria bacterium]